MFTKDTRSNKAARAHARKIPVYYSSVMRIRPAAKVVVAMLLAAMFGTVIGMSAAHAETARSGDDTTTILAQQSQPGGAGNRPGRPPREAMEACAEQASGSACGFAGRDGQQITGTCRAPEADVPPACVPAEMPQKG